MNKKKNPSYLVAFVNLQDNTFGSILWNGKIRDGFDIADIEKSVLELIGARCVVIAFSKFKDKE